MNLDGVIIDKDNIKGQTWVYVPIHCTEELKEFKRIKDPSIWYNDHGKLVAIEFVFTLADKLPKYLKPKKRIHNKRNKRIK